MQRYTIIFILFSVVLHVSGGLSAHHQEFKELYIQQRVFSSFSAAYR
jgi:hypothetical protein